MMRAGSEQSRARQSTGSGRLEAAGKRVRCEAARRPPAEASAGSSLGGGAARNLSAKRLRRPVQGLDGESVSVFVVRLVTLG